MSIVGVIANPLAGKDIRRLVAEASPVPDAAKIAIVRRAVIGAVEGGATTLLLSGDRRGLAHRALDRLTLEADVHIFDEPVADAGVNSTRAAIRMRDEGAGALIVLGGDGTHRDVAKGWRDAPMVALSTGTNNVFPRQIESTVAGFAAGLVASGRVRLEGVAFQAKTIAVSIEGVDEVDLGLVDVALVDSAFTGSRAIWDTDRLRELVAVIAEPATVGLSAIAAAVWPIDRRDQGGVHVSLGSDDSETSVRVAVAPGLFETVGVVGTSRMGAGDTVTMSGPGVLSFDGERDVVLGVGEKAEISVRTDGPWVIDTAAALSRAADERTTVEGR